MTKVELFESPDLSPLDLCLWGCTKSAVSKRKVDTRDQLLSGISDAAARIKKGEDQVRRTTGDLSARVAKCVQTSGVI